MFPFCVMLAAEMAVGGAASVDSRKPFCTSADPEAFMLFDLLVTTP